MPKGACMWIVYILLCSDDSYYIGSTNDLARRFHDHQSGRGGAYTRSHQPLRILHAEEHPDKSSALKREAQLKKCHNIDPAHTQFENFGDLWLPTSLKSSIPAFEHILAK